MSCESMKFNMRCSHNLPILKDQIRIFWIVRSSGIFLSLLQRRTVSNFWFTSVDTQPISPLLDKFGAFLLTPKITTNFIYNTFNFGRFSVSPDDASAVEQYRFNNRLDYVIPPADWYFIYMAPSARLAEFVISVMDFSMSRNLLNQNPRYL